MSEFIARRVGPLLTAGQLEEIRRSVSTAAIGPAVESDLLKLLAHIDALDSTVSNQNAYMAERDADLEGLRSEARRALYLTPLGEVMGRGVMADEVPSIAALLREDDR